MGKHDKAVEIARKAQALMEGSALPLWTLGYSLAKSGRREEAQAVADKMKTLSGQVYMSAYYQALVYTGLGDREKAFTYLEEACEARDGWLIWLGTEPKLDDLRSDPRFDGLLKRVGLNGDETKALGFSDDFTTDVRTVVKESDYKKQITTEEISPAVTTVVDADTAVAKDRRRTQAWIAGLAVVLLLPAVAFVAYRFKQTPGVHFRSVSLNKLTATGNIVNVTISPDGKYAAYVAGES